MLLAKGYEVHGVKRRASLFNTDRIDHLYQDPHVDHPRFTLHYGDLTDSTNLIRIVQQVQPDEIYNLAAQSHVGVSFETPEYTANADGLGTLRLLEAIRILGLEKKSGFIRPARLSCTDWFRRCRSGKRRPSTREVHTQSRSSMPTGLLSTIARPTVCTHVTEYSSTMKVRCVVRHSSRARSLEQSLELRSVSQDCLYLGNLSALRDWGHAKDYVEMQWLMLQQDKPDDFVIATGIQYSVRQFVELAAQELGITITFSGKGEAEIGTVSKVEGEFASCKVGDVIVKVDPRYYRPTEVESLLGDPSKAKRKLGWSPSTTLDQLVAEMIRADYVEAQRDSLVTKAGFRAFNYHE